MEWNGKNKIQQNCYTSIRLEFNSKTVSVFKNEMYLILWLSPCQLDPMKKMKRMTL